MKLKKYEWEDLFVKTSWIAEVWDKNNRRAKRYNQIAMKHLDARCASEQIIKLQTSTSGSVISKRGMTGQRFQR